MTKKEWKKLDKLTEVACKDNAYWRCEICGRGKDMDFQVHWHHYFGRRNTSLRWNLNNSWCLCAGHHKLFKDSFHENTEWGRKQFIDIRGVKLLKQLMTLAPLPNKFDFETNKSLITASAEELLKKYGK